MRAWLVLATLLAPLLASGCVTCGGLAATLRVPGLDAALPTLDLGAAAPTGTRPLPFDAAAAGLPPGDRNVRLLAVVWAPRHGVQLDVGRWDGPTRIVLASAHDLSDEEAAGLLHEFASALRVRDTDALVPPFLASRAHDDGFGPESEWFSVDVPGPLDATPLHASLGPAAPIVKEDPGRYHAERLGAWTFRFERVALESFALETSLGAASARIGRNDTLHLTFASREVTLDMEAQARAAVEDALRALNAPHEIGSWEPRHGYCVG